MKKATWIILAGIMLAVAAVTAAGILDMKPGGKARRMMRNHQFYEAWQLIHEKGLEARFLDDQSVMFYVAMANHEERNTGDSRWVLPDVTGWSCAEIACAMKNVGQAYRVEYTQDPQSFANEVVSQSPPGGRTVSKDDVVTLTANTYHSSNNLCEFPFPAAGLIAEIGEWVYCVHEQDVCRFRADSSDKTVLWENADTDKRIKGLYAGGDRLYCMLQKYDQPDIDEVLMLSLDGDCTPLGELPYSVENRVYGNRLYLALQGVRMYDAQADTVTQVSDEYLCFIEADGYTYSITQDESGTGELTNI